MRSLMSPLVHLVLLALLACGVTAAAEEWPAKPVRILVPAAAGSAADVIGRMLSERLAPRLRQQVLVENRPGGGGITGIAALARSAGDGYTLGFTVASAVVLAPNLVKEANVDVDNDLLAVALAGTSPFIVAVHPGSGIATMDELIARARAQPGKLSFGTASLNNLPYLVATMIARRAGVEFYYVPFNAATQAMTATIAGDVTMMIDGTPTLGPQVKAGRLRAVAVTSKGRLPGYDSVPPVSETIPGFEAGGWFGMFAPKGTPPAVLERVNRETNDLFRERDLLARLADLGVYPNPAPLAETQAFVKSQRELWKKALDDAGVRPQ